MLKKNFYINWLLLLSGFTPIWMLFVNNSIFLTVGDFKEFSLILIIQIFLALIILFVFYLIKINNSNLIIFITLNTFLFFLWNDIKSFLINKFEIISPGIFYYSLIIILNLICLLIIKKKKGIILKYFFIIFYFFNFLLVVFNLTFKMTLTKDIKSDSAAFINKSNIYIIIVDSYGGKDYLEKNINFNNAKIFDYLDSKKFFINQNLFSNYTKTDLSVHSILETNYVHKNSNIILKNHYPELLRTNLPKLVYLAKKNGYNFYSGPWDGCYNILEDFCINNKKKIGKIMKNIFLMTPLNDHTHRFNKKIDEKLKNIFIKKLYLRNNTLENFNLKLNDIYKNKNKKLILLHSLPPHAPYEFNSDCTKKTNFIDHVSSSHNDNYLSLSDQKKFYLDNLICVNKYLVTTIDNILELDKDPIILLTSDHGARIGNNYIMEKKYDDKFDYNLKIDPKTFNSLFNISSMMYLPKKCHKFYEKNISVVNESRILLSCLLNKKIEPLEDRFYLVLENKKLFKLESKN